MPGFSDLMAQLGLGGGFSQMGQFPAAPAATGYEGSGMFSSPGSPMAGNAPGAGLLDRLGAWSAQNPGVLSAIGTGMMEGDLAGGLRDASKLQMLNRATQRKGNSTAAWLKKRGYTDADIQGAIENPEILNAIIAEEAAKRKAKTGEGVEWSKTPVYGTDKSGNTVMGTIGDNGQFKQIDTGGFSISSGVEKVDLGTQWGLLNKRSGQIEGYMPKDIAGEASQKEIGTAAGKSQVAAPGDLQAADNALATIDSIRNDPNKSWGTGFSSILNGIPGSAGRDFQTKVDQAKSGAFLSVIEQLRGMGSLSNAEGQTATAAVNRLSTSTSEAEFNQALDDYETIVRQGRDRAAAKMQGGSATGGDASGAGMNRTSTGASWRVK